MIKLKELVKQQCECGESCCSVNESTEDKIRAQKKFQSLMRQEGLMRDRMFKLEQAFLADSRPENVKLAKELKKIYKSSVTTFMRDTARLVKKLK